MASPNPAPLIPITPNDGKLWRGLTNISSTALTVDVVVEDKGVIHEYTITIQPNAIIPNVCRVAAFSAQVYGWLNN